MRVRRRKPPARALTRSHSQARACARLHVHCAVRLQALMQAVSLCIGGARFSCGAHQQQQPLLPHASAVEQNADCRSARHCGSREQQEAGAAGSRRSTRRPPNSHPHSLSIAYSHPVPFCLLVISGLHPRARGIIAYCARGSASAARGSASDIATCGSATARSLYIPRVSEERF